MLMSLLQQMIEKNKRLTKKREEFLTKWQWSQILRDDKNPTMFTTMLQETACLRTYKGGNVSRAERTSRGKAQNKTNLSHSCCSHPSVVILTLVQ